MASFEHEGIKVGMPVAPYILRINKQVGMFAVGMLDAADPNSIATYGRGKWIEFVVAACDSNLYGSIGKAENKKWAFISAVVTKAEDKRLVPGLLLHFPSYGFESQDFSTMQSEAEIAEIFGGVSPKVIRMEFTKSVSTKYGSIIRPPSLVARDADKNETKYFNAASRILMEFPQHIPDPILLYPRTVDDKGVVSGLSRETLVPVNALPGGANFALPAWECEQEILHQYEQEKKRSLKRLQRDTNF